MVLVVNARNLFEGVVGHKNARNESMNVAYSNGRGQTLHMLQFLQNLIEFIT